jgi:predicted ATPase/transcriptional regulator with XRE-family HTH domain
MLVDLEHGAAFGPLLRSLRLSARLSQEQLAERARMSVEGISALERGRRRAPYRETIRLLGDALSLSDAQRNDLLAAAGRARIPNVGEALETHHHSEPSGGALGRHNLPAQRTRLIGREADVAAIVDLLGEHRIVSLVGTGGIGKTRSALAVGDALALTLKTDTAIRLIEFAPLANGSFVAAAVAHALGVKESPERPLVDSLCAYLTAKSAVLIFDNCEHLIEDAAAVADALLSASAGVRILATSREPLRIAGEQTYRLPSLAVPSRAQSERLSAARALDYAAIALFVDRARGANRNFVFTDDTVHDVAEICRRLDGIALALELAAARVNVLPVRALLEKLNSRFALLDGGARTAMPRHQTMRALIDWSYDLLGPAEQRLFERLSIFAGGCDFVEMAAVCGDGHDEQDVFATLTSLVDKSLVVADTSGREVRFTLLESARIYAAEKLAARGETATVADRHAATYYTLAEHLERERYVAPDAEWLARAEPEIENWRAVLSFTLANPRSVGLGQRLAGALRPVWLAFVIAEGRRWVEAAHARIDAQTPASTIAKLDFAATAIAFAYGEYETALAGSRRLVDRFHELGDTLSAAQSRYYVGGALVSMARVDEGLPLLEAALVEARACANVRLTALILEDVAYGMALAGRAIEARAGLAEARAIWIALGSERNAANSGGLLAENYFIAGEAEPAIEIARENVPKLRALGYQRMLVIALNNLAAYLTACDRWDEAHTNAREALGIALETESDVALAWSMQHLSAIAALSARSPSDSTRFERAAQLLGYVDARLPVLGSPRTKPEQNEYDRARAALTTALGHEAVHELFAAGATLAPGDAIQIAFSFARD